MSERDRNPATPKPGWLEILREPQTQEALTLCPYRGEMLRVSECFGCKDCAGVALDAPAKHSYVVCVRAEADGLATWALDGDTEGAPHAVAVRVTPPPDAEEG